MRTTPAALALSLATFLALPLPAHETDQFTLPPARQFADLGDYFTHWAYGLLQHAVDRTNRDIQSAIDNHHSAESLIELQSPDHIANAVNREIPWAMDLIEGLERQLNAPDFTRK